MLTILKSREINPDAPGDEKNSVILLFCTLQETYFKCNTFTGPKIRRPKLETKKSNYFCKKIFLFFILFFNLHLRCNLGEISFSNILPWKTSSSITSGTYFAAFSHEAPCLVKFR